MVKYIITLLLALWIGLGVKAQDTIRYSSNKQLIVPASQKQYYEDSSYDLILYKSSGNKYLDIKKGRKEELYIIGSLIQSDSAMRIDDQHTGILFIFGATRVAPSWDDIGIQIAIFEGGDDIQAIGVGDVLTIKVYSVVRKDEKQLQP